MRQWFHFEMDEATIAWKVRQFIVQGKPFLIGGGTPFGFHLGPAFYYLSAFPLWLAKLDPIGWGVMASVFGVVTIWLAGRVGRTLYHQRVGLIFALLWASSFVAVMSDRHWWPLVLDPLFSLVTILSLYHVLKGRKRWWLVLGTTLALAWQTDLTVLALLIAAGVVAVRRLKSDRKQIGLAVGILVISFLPLLVFELRHPGANLGKLLEYDFTSHVGSIASFYLGWLEVLVFVPRALSQLLVPVTHLDGNLLEFYSWCKAVAVDRVAGQPWWAAGAALILLLIPLIKLFLIEVSPTSRVADRVVGIMISAGVLGIVLFRLFGGDLFDFYLAPLYPVFLLSAAVITDRVISRNKLIGVVGLAGIIGINLGAFSRSYHPQSLSVKQEAVAWVSGRLGDQPFALESLSACNRYNGARYLFMLAGNEPTMSFMDPDFFWLYDAPSATDYPNTLVVLVDTGGLTVEQKARYNLIKDYQLTAQTFGDLKVVITDNEAGKLEIEY